jgi:hypothetical protein
MKIIEDLIPIIVLNDPNIFYFPTSYQKEYVQYYTLKVEGFQYFAFACDIEAIYLLMFQLYPLCPNLQGCDLFSLCTTLMHE